MFKVVTPDKLEVAAAKLQDRMILEESYGHHRREPITIKDAVDVLESFGIDSECLDEVLALADLEINEEYEELGWR